VRPRIAKVPLEELEHVCSRLADLARDAVLTPARFVKTIGSHPNADAVAGDQRIGDDEHRDRDDAHGLSSEASRTPVNG
jgi:hypothetical protein